MENKYLIQKWIKDGLSFPIRNQNNASPDQEGTSSSTAALAAATAALTISSTSASVGGGGGGGRNYPAKKKRGRPRKHYATGDPLMRMAMIPPSAAPSPKRPRKPRLDLSSLGGIQSVTSGDNITPHAITINAKEDVILKIISFCGECHEGLIVLAATGTISSASLRRSSGTFNYLGQYEIVSLTGSYRSESENDDEARSCGASGDFTVSLVELSGRIIAGGVAGQLIAASPIEAVIGTYVPRANKTRPKKKLNFRSKQQEQGPSHFNPQAVFTQTEVLLQGSQTLNQDIEEPSPHMHPSP